MIAAVVAMDRNRVIGSKNDLPWYLPADLKHFKEITEGHTVLMGRKTWESIFTRLGRPLPNRRNVVLTRDNSFSAEGVEAVNNIGTFFADTEEDIYVIGGAEVYKLALPFLHRLYVTQVDVEVDGDAHFPDYSEQDWKEISRENHEADEKNPYNYSFIVLDKRYAD